MQRQEEWPMDCFYDFLPLAGLFLKVILIHNRFFRAITAGLYLKSAKAYGKILYLKEYTLSNEKIAERKDLHRSPCNKQPADCKTKKGV